MRIKINLSACNDTSIPIEYNYNLYLNFRKTLFDFLQQHKPKLFSKYKKDFPFFTFSQLMIPERKVEPGFIRIRGNYLSIFVSSADDGFMEYLVKAINHQKEFHIYHEKFNLKKIEVIEEPDFEPEMKFRMLSPLLLMTVKDNKPYFARPGDSDLNDIFAAGLVKEYNRVYTGNFQPSQIRLELDQDYISRKKNITKLLTIRNIHYKAIFCPFRLKGEVDLIRFGYRNGIGDRTHYGFGMIEVS
jgi:CRISPR-associated endoribonuclease Cas6